MKFILILSLGFLSCTNIKNTVSEKSNEVKVDEKKKVSRFNYTVLDVEVYNGKTKFVEFATDYDDGLYKLNCVQTDHKNVEYSVSIRGGKGRVYLAESYFSSPIKRSCFLDAHHIMNVSVRPFNYKKERLNVAKSKIDLSKKNLARVIRERKITAEVYKNSADTFLFTEKFKVPLKSYITSHYGNIRLFNNKKRSQHLGNDFRAAVGVPIPAANRGRVVYTGNLFYSGNVVIVDHGVDIFTIYAHLSKIKASKGDIINKGDIVGLAGRTGRVSGPHLHWGVKISGNSVDGFSLVEESIEHFATNEVAL